MIDVNKLRGAIIEKGKTQQEVAYEIGMNKSTFYKKMKEGGNFSIREVQKLFETIPLSKEKAIEIFFADYVA